MTTYTHGHQESVLRSHRWRTAANSAAYLLPHLQPGMTLLDVGCGPGTITADLATLVGKVTGIDPSASVIEDATKAFPGLDLRVGDVFEHNGHYDVVHAHQVLQHLSDPVAALRKMASLGDLVAARDGDYSAFTWGPDDASISRWLEIYLAVTRHNGAEANAGRHLLRWAHEAGLTDTAFSWSAWTYATPEALAFWCGVWADRCIDSSFAQQAVDYGITSTSELAGVARGWRAFATNPDAVFVVPSGEILART